MTSSVAALQLLETGNLVLVGPRNEFLWQSFDYPTDTIVNGQRFPVGNTLVSASSDVDFSEGDYRLTLTGEDLVSQWYGQTYWSLSMNPNSTRNSKNAVSFMEMNSSGLYLYGAEKSVVVAEIILPATNFRIAYLGHDGRFMIQSIDSNGWNQELVSLVEFCQMPLSCDQLGLCIRRSDELIGLCTCPENFGFDNRKNSCLPVDNSSYLSTGCNASGSSTGNDIESASPSYLKLGNNVHYFINDFSDPVKRGIGVPICQDLCSKNCSCLGIFHHNSSGSCYLAENHIGSIKFSNYTESEYSGYAKVFQVSTGKKKHNFPIAGFVLIPLSGFGMVILFLGMAVFWFRKKRASKNVAMNLERWNSSSSTVPGSLPGLPSRFEYEQLVAATENFSTKIGSGGFGTVYKGTMPDNTTVVAVKKITNLGVQGKKEFYTEIATIGAIRHANLVRLKGFCIRERQRFLVYEFMNRGSLERILFNNGPVLEWQDRFRIIYGTARALAYLHTGCHQKIIHCDIKPENILLNDSFQVKVSDFGLSKILDHENSKLFTVLRGTRGYLAPEWLTSSGITDKTDVYSFGMVLIEIVSGRRNCSLLSRNCGIENEGSEENGLLFSSSCSLERLTYFPSLALEMHKQKRYLELADPRMEGQVSGEDIEKIVRIALCCLHVVPMLRPTMDNVVAMLEDRVPSSEPRVEVLNFLQSFDAR